MFNRIGRSRLAPKNAIMVSTPESHQQVIQNRFSEMQAPLSTLCAYSFYSPNQTFSFDSWDLNESNQERLADLAASRQLVIAVVDGENEGHQISMTNWLHLLIEKASVKENLRVLLFAMFQHSAPNDHAGFHPSIVTSRYIRSGKVSVCKISAETGYRTQKEKSRPKGVIALQQCYISDRTCNNMIDMGFCWISDEQKVVSGANHRDLARTTIFRGRTSAESIKKELLESFREYNVCPLDSDTKGAEGDEEKPVENVEIVSDDALLEQFEDLSLPLAKWDHKNRLRIVFLHLERFGLEDCLDPNGTLCQRWYRFKDSVGHGQRWHVTLTLFWVQLLEAARRSSEENVSFESVWEDHPEFHAGRLFEEYYTTELLLGEDSSAQHEWIPPDLKPLPIV